MNFLIIIAISMGASTPVEPPADFDQRARAAITERLRDPQTAVIENARPPMMGTFPFRQSVVEREQISGWLGCYRVNARNAYGGYTGFASYAVILRDDGTTWVRWSRRGWGNDLNGYCNEAS